MFIGRYNCNEKIYVRSHHTTWSLFQSNSFNNDSLNVIKLARFILQLWKARMNISVIMNPRRDCRKYRGSLFDRIRKS